MIPVQESDVFRAMRVQNPWWDEKTVPDHLTGSFLRRDFFTLGKRLDNEEILAIVGPRQVGKTTLMFQLAKELIRTGTDPLEIFYFSFDYPYTLKMLERPLSDLIDFYLRDVLEEPLTREMGKVYILLDEITRLESWNEVLKGWYDLKFPIKFMISDSSYTEVWGGIATSLLGRSDVQIVMSMKFVDVATFYTEDDKLDRLSHRFRDGLDKSLEKNDPLPLFEEWRRSIAQSSTNETLSIISNKFLLSDGYPGLLSMDNKYEISRRLRDYIDQTLFRDIISRFEIKNPHAIEALLGLIASESSQVMSVNTMCDSLSLRTETVNRYLDLLEQAFLISRAPVYTGSYAKSLRRMNKYYMCNLGFRNVLTANLNALPIEGKEIGKIVETAVFDHVLRLKYSLEPGTRPILNYWKDRSGRELDIVLELGGRPIPIEVKYRNVIESRDIRALKEFMNEFDTPFGIVITKNMLELSNNVIFVPLPLFLLTC